jgi:hypothetical protein
MAAVGLRISRKMSTMVAQTQRSRIDRAATLSSPALLGIFQRVHVGLFSTLYSFSAADLARFTADPYWRTSPWLWNKKVSA